MKVKFEFSKIEIAAIDNMIVGVNKILNNEEGQIPINLISEQKITDDFIIESQTMAATVESKYTGESMDVILNVNEQFFDEVIAFGSSFINPIYNFCRQIVQILKENPLKKWYQKEDINTDFYKKLFQDGYKYLMQSSDGDESKNLVFKEKTDLIAYIINNNLSGYKAINLETEEVIINA